MYDIYWKGRSQNYLSLKKFVTKYLNDNSVKKKIIIPLNYYIDVGNVLIKCLRLLNFIRVTLLQFHCKIM